MSEDSKAARSELIQKLARMMHYALLPDELQMLVAGTADVTPDELSAGCKAILFDDNFFPVLARLREACGKGGKVQATQALTEALDELRRVGQYDRPVLGAAAAAGIRAVGGWRAWVDLPTEGYAREAMIKRFLVGAQNPQAFQGPLGLPGTTRDTEIKALPEPSQADRAAAIDALMEAMEGGDTEGEGDEAAEYEKAMNHREVDE